METNYYTRCEHITDTSGVKKSVGTPCYASRSSDKRILTLMFEDNTIVTLNGLEWWLPGVDKGISSVNQLAMVGLWELEDRNFLKVIELTIAAIQAEKAMSS